MAGLQMDITANAPDLELRVTQTVYDKEAIDALIPAKINPGPDVLHCDNVTMKGDGVNTPISVICTPKLQTPRSMVTSCFGARLETVQTFTGLANITLGGNRQNYTRNTNENVRYGNNAIRPHITYITGTCEAQISAYNSLAPRLPAPPVADGRYCLACDTSSGAAVYYWKLIP